MSRWSTGASLAILLALAAGGWAADPPVPLHPPVPLLDSDGVPVVRSSQPVSTMRSCGGCHDAGYIAAHSYHASLGRDERTAVGAAAERRPWDYSPGSFGRWSPLSYRYLTPPGDERLDLGVADWIRTQGGRHVGGGPAEYGHGSGSPRAAAPGPVSSGVDPDRHVLDETNGSPRPWDWQASGVVEMNCFLCHTAEPDNAARIAELAAGRFRWASTATLSATGLVRRTEGGWVYAAAAFDAEGRAPAERLGIREPTSLHCGQCHGLVHRGEQPLVLDATLTGIATGVTEIEANSSRATDEARPAVAGIFAAESFPGALRQWSTATKGQVFSPQRISQSGIDMAGKLRLVRPWDVHAEALLECQDCHFSLNNPVSFVSSPRNRPQHLRYEPRRLALGEYLRRPSHQFAKGQAAQGTLASHLAGTMRGCGDCHDAAATHGWLPYRSVHFERLSCEACHVSQTYSPALQQVDWTLIDPQGQPRRSWRGVQGEPGDGRPQVTGFRPVLLPRRDLDGRTRLVPHNLVTAWYWVEGGPAPRPVREHDLRRALLDSDGYQADILAVLDADGDGAVNAAECVLDSPEKVAAVQRMLAAVGVESPQIVGEIQPFGTHHGVGPGATAVRDCNQCHRRDSRLVEPFDLAVGHPAGPLPTLVNDGGVALAGRLQQRDGLLTYLPDTRAAGLYVLGRDRYRAVDWLGGLAVLGVLAGAAVHSAMRLRAYRSGRS